MLNSLNIAGYKCFDSGTGYIELGKLNVFCGKNSSGKSSFLQPLLLLRQTLFQYPTSKSIRLNGRYINLGSYEEIDPQEGGGEDIVFGFTFSNHIKGNFKSQFIMRFSPNEKKREIIENEGEILLKEIEIAGTTFDNISFGPHLVKFQSFENDKKVYREAIFPKLVSKDKSEVRVVNALETFLPIELTPLEDSFNRFIKDLNESWGLNDLYYLNSSRVGPLTAQVSNLKSLQELLPDGSNSFGLFSLYFGKGIDPSLALDPTDKNFYYENQVSLWINFIFNSKVDIKALTDQIFKSTFNGTSSAANVGFGLSYTLHIVLLCLAPTAKKHIVIENPEAHLEPSAQYRLMQFLDKVAQAGCQIYIETHSDTIVNAIRLFSKADVEKAKNYRVFFVSKTEDGTNESIIQNVNISETGLWPKGFFDQNQEILKKLYGI